MTILIKEARLICAASPHHGQVVDILIINGRIEKINKFIEHNSDYHIQVDDLHVSIGWMDTFASFEDPGFEHKETITSGSEAAAAGGFTDVMVLPNTAPAVSTKSIVEYIRQKAANLAVNIHPIAAITKNTEGKELTEMYDMFSSGAIAFSDGTNSIQSPGVLLKALQYVLPLGATVIQLPDDKSISNHGLMNEGIQSTQLGLPGRPAIAEELMIARDIELLKYTGSKLHITGISTKKSVELISAAKRSGLQITCSVSPAHLIFSDEDLSTYDTNLKLNPPLRTPEDRDALKQGLIQGDIDCIASHHFPQHWDDKTCEFEYARNGTIALQQVFGVANNVVDDINKLVEQLTVVPRHIFSLPVPTLEEGAPASLTLFTTKEEYLSTTDMIRSLSHNCAFTGLKLKGRVVGIVNNNKIMLNN